MRLSWILPLSSALPVWSATSGRFNVLSFNIAGLPQALNSNGVKGDKGTNAETIGSRFAQYDYDVIQVQEVCSCYGFHSRRDTDHFRILTTTRISIKPTTIRIGPRPPEAPLSDPG